MHAQVPKPRTRVATMSHRAMNPKAQKEGKKRFSAHYRKQSLAFYSPRSPRSPCSPAYRRHHAQRNSRASPVQLSPHKPCPPMMSIIISAALRRWLLEKGFEGYILVVEAPPHPDVLDITRKLNIDTVTNASI